MTALKEALKALSNVAAHRKRMTPDKKDPRRSDNEGPYIHTASHKIMLALKVIIS